jgi:hypothetical protein
MGARVRQAAVILAMIAGGLLVFAIFAFG